MMLDTNAISALADENQNITAVLDKATSGSPPSPASTTCPSSRKTATSTTSPASSESAGRRDKVAKYAGTDRIDLIENEEYGNCCLVKAT